MWAGNIKDLTRLSVEDRLELSIWFKLYIVIFTCMQITWGQGAVAEWGRSAVAEWVGARWPSGLERGGGARWPSGLERGGGARWPSGLEHWLGLATGLSWQGSNPTAENFASELWQFRFTPLCQCLSEETLKAVGPFYRVSMPGEVKEPTSPHWNV